MPGSLTPEAANASDDTGEVAYRPTGTGTANDGRKVRGVVLVDTTGNAYAASGGGGGGGAATIADGADVAQGTTTDAASASTVIGLLKNLKAALAGTLTVSGTVTSNAGTGTLATSVADGQNVAIGTTTDASSASTTIGLLKNLKAALAGTLTVSGAVTNSNLDVALSTRLKPADTLTAVTTVGAVTAITNALPAGTNTIGAVKEASQSSLTATLATNVTTSTSTTGQSLDGYDGAATIELVAVGTGTQAVSLQIEGSLDNANWYIVGAAQIDATANPTYAAANFTLTLVAGATQRHLYALRDTVKYVRLTTTANTLATGLSSTLYTNPV